MSLETIVSHFIKSDLTGDEIKRLTGKSPVLYSDLKNYSSLKQLLGSENCVIVLYQTSSRTTGHYVAITMNKAGKIRYCDSYGIQSPDAELQFTPFDKVLPKYLTKLLAPYQFESNSVDYQSKSSNVSTCGRYASLFCRFKDLSLRQINELFGGNKDVYLQRADNVATLLTLLSLNDITEYLQDLPRSL
jgi:hypothetical protein